MSDQYVDQDQCDRRMQVMKGEFNKCLDVIQTDLKAVCTKIDMIKDQVYGQALECATGAAEEKRERSIKDVVMEYRQEILLMILIAILGGDNLVPLLKGVF